MLIYNNEHPIYQSEFHYFIETFEYQALHFYNQSKDKQIICEKTNILPKNHSHYSFLNHFEFLIKNINTNHLNHYCNDIIILLSYLPFHLFCSVFNYIDDKFPGISFHYVIEAQNYLFKEEDKEIQNSLLYSSCTIFLTRLYILKETEKLNYLFSPMRTRLINELLHEKEFNIDFIMNEDIDNDDWNCLKWVYSYETIWKDNVEQKLNEYSTIFVQNKNKFLNMINYYLYAQNIHPKFNELMMNNLLNKK